MTEAVVEEIRDCIELAPLHNPHNLKGYQVCRQLLPEVPQVAVFDTAFHQTMPPSAYLYGLPYLLYRRHQIRRYGFHGTSHRFVAYRFRQMFNLQKETTNLITCHLGNGCSVCAIEAGKSVDTSMGFTPLEGLVMGTRCGDLDPAIIVHLMAKEDLSLHEVSSLLNKHSAVCMEFRESLVTCGSCRGGGGRAHPSSTCDRHLHLSGSKVHRCLLRCSGESRRADFYRRDRRECSAHSCRKLRTPGFFRNRH